jgi:hypothetical protein
MFKNGAEKSGFTMPEMWLGTPVLLTAFYIRSV